MAKEQHFLEQHDPDRKDFQIDRIILFSDAVFAIAITLLVIEIKAPFIQPGDSDAESLRQLGHLVSKFVGFIISFFVVAIFWRSHHRLFGFVNQYSSKLIKVNFMVLFCIVLMPFSSAYYSENFNRSVPFYFYTGNIFLCGLFNYFLFRVIFNPKNQLISHWPDRLFIQKFKVRSMIPPFVFASAIMVNTFSPTLARYWYFIAIPLTILTKWYFNRKYHEPVRKTNKPAAKPVEESRAE